MVPFTYTLTKKFHVRLYKILYQSAAKAVLFVFRFIALTFLSVLQIDAGRRSLKGKMGPTLTDIPTALDSAIDILIKQYNFREIQNTFKIMLNIFRFVV